MTTDIETLRKLMIVKPLDLSNVLRHAFLSGVIAARNIPGHSEIDGGKLWLDYEPYEPGSYARVLAALTPSPEAQAEPVATSHPDDTAVNRFAYAMKIKLSRKRAAGRGGWNDKAACSAESLSQMLREHVEKGDPVDVANFAMMLHQRGEKITTARPPAPQPEALSANEALIQARNLIAERRNKEKPGPIFEAYNMAMEAVEHVRFRKPVEAQEQLKVLREALEWYAEKARLCRLIHSGGDAGRHALDADGGQIARAALASTKGGDA